MNHANTDTLPGSVATFHAGTKAIWTVPEHAKKSYTLHHPDWAVRLTRRVLTAVRPG